MTNREYMMMLDNEKLVDFIYNEYDHVWFDFFASEPAAGRETLPRVKYTNDKMAEWLGLDRTIEE